MLQKLVGLLSIILIIIGLQYIGLLKFIKIIDEEYFDSNIRNIYGYYIKKEYWDLKDASFMENNILQYSNNNFVNIAHGLGARNTDQENSYEAFNYSLTRGFKFFEVDIFLDYDGNLNCSHDEPKFKSFCNLEDLLRKVHARKSYLIIDIKSDFYKTFNLIAEIAESTDDPIWTSLILQIYKPKELEHYSKSLAHKRFFNPPIISTYKSNRKISGICKELTNTGIDTIALAKNKARFHDSSCEEFNIIIFPVQSCGEILDFNNISGIFTNNEIHPCRI